MDTEYLVIGADFLTIGADFLVLGAGLPPGPPSSKSLQLNLILKWEDGVLQINGVGDWID